MNIVHDGRKAQTTIGSYILLDGEARETVLLLNHSIAAADSIATTRTREFRLLRELEVEVEQYSEDKQWHLLECLSIYCQEFENDEVPEAVACSYYHRMHARAVGRQCDVR